MTKDVRDIRSTSVSSGSSILEQTGAELRARQQRIAALEAENGRLRASLEMLVREAQSVADDSHYPRYYRLDEALLSARATIEAENAALRIKAARYDRMRAATFSHVDQRDLLAELKPNAWHFCNIKVQARRNGEWHEYEGDWLRKLWHARDRDGGPYIEALDKDVAALNSAQTPVDAARKDSGK